MPEPRDTGDLLDVPEDQRLDVDPDPFEDGTHAAVGDEGPDDLNDVPEGEYVDPESYQEADNG